MKITIGQLKALIKEATRRDSRMSGGKVGKALNAEPTNPEVDALKKAIRFQKTQIAKFQKAGKTRDLPEMQAYLVELEEKLARMS